MKKLVLMVAAIATMAITGCNEKAAATIDEANLTAAAERESVAGDFPAMTFEQVEYDFGTVDEGTVVEHEYKFKNTGSAPLIVVNAKGSCGCTVPTWSKEPIAPGEEGSMLVKFNTNGKPNNQTKTVTIKANTESGTESIRIKGFVTPKAKPAAPNA
ncbi:MULTISPECIES: DUF1573 domain-containing protein [Nonlabens]|mgnify:CR=1 FL=1|uniref:Uncharacterized protein DUF1573 n=2 Tax=Nonlabens ulvanivorans TaxID=906888 RepID=A0A084JY64_NONUL|nr:DUF1573 domain-containing protein [Nonlabens ulvanivorans]KEZ93898.1 hypothetical protein IL45_06790 [Nonlabens ulvanivorans]PRX14507.1 uncharacterized protein DUF1573 [Nonlabens ulvanivorans]WOI22956.1 DUF1573 domain-containing protein [Nonlabens ulvanivorans]GAK77024.1 hypothetical protein JCM19296_2628 [Nonlabens ulvanivorans]GAK89554.1 hypothetical protein JCM19297_1382 [Nonlabens ulvanivorans]